MVRALDIAAEVGKCQLSTALHFGVVLKKYQKMMSDAKHSFLVSFSGVFRFFTSDLRNAQGFCWVPPKRLHHVAPLVPTFGVRFS